MTYPERPSASGSKIGIIGDYGTVNYNSYAAPVVVSWPVRVGLLPAVADQYQDRGFDLDAEFDTGLEQQPNGQWR